MRETKSSRILWSSLILCMLIIFAVPGFKVEAAAKVRMNKTSVSIYKKKTCRLVMRNVKAGTKVTWKTSKSSMASIKAKGTSCTVTGKKDGTAV